MSLTPDGHKYDLADPTALTGCWIQKTQFPNLVKYNADVNKTAYLTDYILMACAEVNKICNRKFNKQTSDQIFRNETLFFRDYKSYVLKNRPLISITNVWVEVTNNFSAVDSTYFQVDTSAGVVKILPTFSVYVNTTLPMFSLQTASNVWVRYSSGFDVDYSVGHSTNEVPYPVRMATALMVDYLFSCSDLVGGVKSFSTQTYSQTNASPEEDAILSRIDKLLEPYKISYVV